MHKDGGDVRYNWNAFLDEVKALQLGHPIWSEITENKQKLWDLEESRKALEREGDAKFQQQIDALTIKHRQLQWIDTKEVRRTIAQQKTKLEKLHGQMANIEQSDEIEIDRKLVARRQKAPGHLKRLAASLQEALNYIDEIIVANPDDLCEPWVRPCALPFCDRKCYVAAQWPEAIASSPLSCGHCLCRFCEIRVVSCKGGEGNAVKCPICREYTPLSHLVCGDCERGERVDDGMKEWTMA